MKKLLLLSVSFLSFYCAFAQNTAFRKGQTDLQVGIGFFSTLGNTNDYDIGISTPLKSPPVSFVVDHAVSADFSAGIYLATAKSDAYYQDLFQRIKLGSINHFIFGVRGLYHLELLKKLDTYGGVMLGYNKLSAKGFDDSEATESGFTYTLLAGGRYRFTDHAGVFLELGYGVSAVNLGLNLTF